MKTHFTAKALLVCFIFFLSANEMQAQQWTWMKGDSSINQYGVYGTRGISSPNNKPGARFGSVTWKDNLGNIWLFGGIGYSLTVNNYYLNDLWKYTPSTNNWTWVNGSNIWDPSTVCGTLGIPSANNYPGARVGSVGWTDKSGNLWLFGGERIPYNGGVGAFCNQLWKYNISTNQWAWMSGDSSLVNQPNGNHGIQGVASASNVPSARFYCNGWTDTAGHFWMFGGGGIPATYTNNSFGDMNDLWEYNPFTNLWTWMKGSLTIKAPSVYGIQNTPSANNTPGSRDYCFNWRDAQNNFWLFGGYADYLNGNYYNDLWKYIPSSNEWVWVKGDTVLNAIGSYGTMGIPLPSNNPSARGSNGLQWIDKYGNLWFFGSYVYQNLGEFYNDMWRFNPSTSEWTWMKGNNLTNIKGIYGTKGIPSDTTYPGARTASTSWTDLSGNFWLFGGGLYDSLNYNGLVNDLWSYTPDTTHILPVHLPTFTARLQDKQTHLHWTVENEQNFDCYQIERSINGKDYTAIGIVKAIHARQYIFTDNNPFATPSPLERAGVRSFYRLKLIDRDGQFSYSKIASVKLPTDNKFSISPNPAKDNIQLQFSKILTGKSNIEITDANGKVMLQKTIEASGSNLSVSTSTLPSGIYTVRFMNNGDEYLQKVVVVK